MARLFLKCNFMKYTFLLLLVPMMAWSQSSKIQLDGVVNTEEWAGTQKHLIQYEFDPGDNVSSVNKTEVWITYSATDLYVGFIAYGNSSELRSSIRNRDEAWQDDFVMIGLDTFGDGRFLVNAGANAAGSQLDMKLTASGEDDPNYNINFVSKASIHEDSYHVELQIPFSSLQFTQLEEMDWKVVLYRSTFVGGARSQNFQFPLDRDNPCIPCQSPTHLLLKGVKSTKRAQLIPYVFGGQSGAREAGDFKMGGVTGNVGLSGLFDLSPTTSLEVAFNPDFSQVEADVSQITVNNTFAIAFPERRPYFNEGNDLIQTELSTVYTRAINQPLFSSKLIAQGAKQRTYWLTAYDEVSPYLIPARYTTYSAEGGASYASIFRTQRMFKNSSSLGFLSTHRFFSFGGSGHTLGFDGTYRFPKTYTAGFEYNQSIHNEPVADWFSTGERIGNYTVDLDGETQNGTSGLFYLARNTRNWNSGMSYVFMGQHYQTPLGFTNQNDAQVLQLRHRYTHFFEPDQVWKQLEAGIRFEDVRTIEGMKRFQSVNFQSIMGWANGMLAEISHRIIPYEEFDGYLGKDLYMSSVFFRFNPGERMNMRLFTERGKQIYYNADAPVVGEALFIGSFNDFQWGNQLKLSPSLRYSEMKSIDGAELYYSGMILRLNADFQINKDFSFRLVTEANNFNDTSFVQALLKWNPNPFTIGYIGATNGYSYTEPGYGYKIDTAQLYLKFQYLFDL